MFFNRSGLFYISIAVTECKEKWKNIRSTFRRSKKPASIGSRPKKEYYLTKHLEFLLPHMKSIQNTSDYDERPSGENECQTLVTDNETQLFQDIKEEISDQGSSIGVSDDSIADHASCSFAEFSLLSQHTRGLKKQHGTEVDTSIEYLEENRKETQSTPIHPMRHFFLSLMGEFDTMTESQTRHFKIRVLQLIDEIKTNTASSVQVVASPESSNTALQLYTTNQINPENYELN